MIYLVITPFFPTPERFNGPFIYDFVKAVDRSARFSRILVMRPKSVFDKRKKYEYEGIEVILFTRLCLPSNIFPFLFNNLNDLLLNRKLKVLQIEKKDIAVAHAHLSSFAHYLNSLKKINQNIKTILHYHNPDPFNIRLGRFSKYTWHRRIVANFESEQCSKLDTHVGVSNKVINNAEAFPKLTGKDVFPGYNNMLKDLNTCKQLSIKQKLTLYNGVDTKKFYRQSETKHPDNIFRIGCIANFVDWKDQITLIKAIELLITNYNQSDIKVILVGSGPLLNQCKQYVDDQNLSDYFDFQQEVHHRQLVQFYNALNLFVLPSVFEGFGCVFTEAYACGVPFMAVKNQGISEYIYSEDAAKWLIKPGDYNSLAEKIYNFRKYNYTQQLKHPIDINILVGEFLGYLTNEVQY